MDHVAIDHLAGTPEILRILMTGVSEEQASWKPSPERWSIAEVLEHLSHVEAHLFRARFDLLIAEDTPAVESYDEEVFNAAGVYSNRDAEESFAHWEEQREDNVDFLRSLERGSLARSGAYPAAGTFTLEDTLNAWAFHDLGHIRQIAELVRAQMYYSKLGPFASMTSVKP